MEIKTLEELYDAVRSEMARGTEANGTRINELTAKLEAGLLRVHTLESAGTPHPLNEPISGYQANGTGNPEKDFSWLRFFRGCVNGWDQNREPGCHKWPEYELTMEVTAKAQSSGVDTAGGFMVAPQIFIDQIIPVLEPRVVAIAAGITVIDDLIGSPVEFPRYDNLAAGFWTDEGSTISETSLTLSQISLSPHGLASLVELTQRLLRQTSGKAETAVRDQLARALARTLDLAIFKGTGGSSQPVGLLNQANVGTVDIDATEYGTNPMGGSGAGQKMTDALEDMIGLLEDANALFGKPVWFMNPQTRRWFNKFKDANGRPLLFEKDTPQSSTKGSAASMFYGYPYYTSTQLVGGTTDDDLIFCNIEEALLGQWGGLAIATDQSVGFTRATTYVRAIMEVDVGLRHGAAVGSALNLDTSTDPTP